ncbi:NAD(P)-dependent dehydrogenase (short-subunit alcohol dehydrogenase family) [Variovorax paradoxus]|uniref:SDR family oxidoreductase n=1 Tax=Variovorax paradoxus TaxID=34073 RepID=UPI00278A8263|nr:SDR family oxidoreductase [Variovorax paradoxus]MDP9930588.1 NAD(P)-dependent dehydrogenase (short-subunit alcohol dehydrogenase family) [Variovorax paradoxus]MDQ0023067.1 NAD(P)-dependent dehydrogenase (short-subunit alcohol dehydrogenase family) [Variovorax paradoxus]
MTELKAVPDPSSLQALLAELPANLLAGRRILVTGGARGLGLAFAQCIAAAGASVVLADILGDLAETEAKALRDAGRQADALAVDLSEPASIEAGAAEAVRLLGGLDGLVNNAAITNSGGRDAHQLEIDTWDRVMNVNVRGTWLMSRACQPALAASGRGAIVNLASDTALWGAPNLLAYASSKGAVVSMTRSLAREWGGDNITVNAVAPGLTLVEATEYVPMARHQKYLEGRAIPREQQAADVCGAALYLLSGLARFVTGQLLAVNGGFAMH